MYLIRHGRLIKRPAPAIEPAPALVSKSASTPKPSLINVLLRQLIEICIKQAQDNLADPRKESDKLFKPQNPDLYYGNSDMKCYYFCQQCKDYFKIIRYLKHKQIPFTANFLKDRILN